MRYQCFVTVAGRQKLRNNTQGPEIQSMYSLNMPVSKIRTKMRQEFEKHRYVNHLQAVDVLITHSHAEFQVSGYRDLGGDGTLLNQRASSFIGDDEFLEATVACYEILPSRGR